MSHTPRGGSPGAVRPPSPRLDAERYATHSRASYDALTGHAAASTPPLAADHSAIDHGTVGDAAMYANTYMPAASRPVPALFTRQSHMGSTTGGASSARSEKNLQWSEQVVDEPSMDRTRARSASPRPSSSAAASPRTPRSLSPSPRMSTTSQQSPRVITPRLWSPRSRLSDGDESAYSSDPIERIPLDFNIFFQNAKLSPMAPRQTEISPKHTLPEDVFFFIHVSCYPCSYPLPKEYPEHQYLHRASVYAGHEAAGPAVQMRFNPSTVVGLRPHHMTKGKCTQQLVLVVPVTRVRPRHVAHARP